MPNFDRTGPLGLGPGTGWGRGPCGAGMRKGIGWRRFWGYCPGPAFTKKEEQDILQEETAVLEQELKAVKERLAELKGKK